MKKTIPLFLMLNVFCLSSCVPKYQENDSSISEDIIDSSEQANPSDKLVINTSGKKLSDKSFALSVSNVKSSKRTFDYSAKEYKSLPNTSYLQTSDTEQFLTLLEDISQEETYANDGFTFFMDGRKSTHLKSDHLVNHCVTTSDEEVVSTSFVVSDVSTCSFKSPSGERYDARLSIGSLKISNNVWNVLPEKHKINIPPLYVDIDGSRFLEQSYIDSYLIKKSTSKGIESSIKATIPLKYKVVADENPYAEYMRSHDLLNDDGSYTWGGIFIDIQYPYTKDDDGAIHYANPMSELDSDLAFGQLLNECLPTMSVFDYELTHKTMMDKYSQTAIDSLK